MENNGKKMRIWELDAFRGLCIIGMVAVHTVWDLDNELPDFDPPLIYDILIKYGGLLFIMLSGICVTLGKSSVKRGLFVLCFACLVSVGFMLAEPLGFGSFAPVYFGILHLLGVSMILYPIYKNLPFWSLMLMGVARILLGEYVINATYTDIKPLLALGFRTDVRGMSDYFPLFPNLGWFLLGAGIGKLIYKNKTSLLPKVPHDNWFCRFLTFCGRQSLYIYVLHQPIIYGVLMLIL